jgi:hypothetical protein
MVPPEVAEERKIVRTEIHNLIKKSSFGEAGKKSARQKAIQRVDREQRNRFADKGKASLLEGRIPEPPEKTGQRPSRTRRDERKKRRLRIGEKVLEKGNRGGGDFAVIDDETSRAGVKR